MKCNAHMTYLFWTLWIIDILLLALTVLGKNFRSGFGAGVDLNILFIVILLIILAASLWIWLVLKQKMTGVIVAGLPMLAMLIYYFIDTKKSSQN